MKRIKLVGLCLVAMFAVSAVVASAAMATSSGPYIKAKKGTTEWTLGEYPGGPKEEAKEAVKIKARLKSGTKGKLYVKALYSGGPLVECNGMTGEGEGYNSWQEKIHSEGLLKKGKVTFTECTLPAFPHCAVEGGAVGVGSIKAENILGRLGYKPGETVAEREAGDGVEGLIFPETGKLFTTLEIFENSKDKGTCTLEESYEVNGGVIGTGAPVNAFATQLTVKAKAVSLKQELTEIEFPEWNEETKKSEKQTLKGQELSVGHNPSALEGEIELYEPVLVGGPETGKAVEVGIFTKP